ncbi:MAG: 3-isopropylmalate dehydratase small subunit [Planctomycetota bacterium]|jgi:3-isopropylmalate/(R)-2-methylmalate dehydratase small subunit
MKTFGGTVLVLDRSDINTDEIIPAKYLTEISKEALKPHLLEDLELKGFDPAGQPLQAASVVLSRSNFGCGSSREHAPWAFEVNGINAIVAEGFSRIFRQNMYNSGMLAIELPKAEIGALIKIAKGGKATMRFDLKKKSLTCTAGKQSHTSAFGLDDFAMKLIKAGGWVSYANATY